MLLAFIVSIFALIEFVALLVILINRVKEVNTKKLYHEMRREFNSSMVHIRKLENLLEKTRQVNNK